MQDKFYHYVHHRMGLLLAWGTLNVAAGSLLSLLSRDKYWKHFWLQCVGWGGVDALLAGFSRRSYRRKLARLAGNTSGRTETWLKEAKTIFLVLAVNVCLDLGYMLAGEWFRRKGHASGKPDQAGMGFGFIMQGLFLFLFDAWLSLEIKRRWLEK
jgi:hypothetical protein